MSAPAYTVAVSEAGTARLMVHGAELLAGPEADLRAMAAALNAVPPTSLDELRDALRRLIMTTRAVSFAPGPALRAAQGVEL